MDGPAIQGYLAGISTDPAEFNRQKDFCDELNLLITPSPAAFNNLDAANPDALNATQILINNFVCNFRMEGRNGASPFFMIAYAYYRTIQRASNAMRQENPNARLRSFMLYFSVRRPGTVDDQDYNRLRYRVEVPQGNNNFGSFITDGVEFNRKSLLFLSPHVASLLAEEHYSGVDLQVYEDLIDVGGVVPNERVIERAGMQTRNRPNRIIETIADVALETTCFFYGNRGALNRARTLTAYDREQRFNRNRRAGNFGGKRKMFYHGNETQFHSQAQETLQCMHANPLVDGEFCFPMAFLTSQVRELTLVGDSITERLSQPKTVESMRSLHTYPYLVIPYSGEEKIPEFTRGDNLVLFNPIKAVDAVLWEKAGKYLHNYVETQLGEGVDYTSWKECPQAYSDVFGVVIHVFLKGERSRFDVYVPNKKPEIVRHVYMYCDDGHFNPIIDLRTFTSSMCTAPNTWCDCCQTRLSSYQAPAKREQHIKKCIQLWKFVSEPCVDFLDTTHREAAIPIRKGAGPREFCNQHNVFDCKCSNYSMGNRTREHVYICNICNHESSYKEFAYKHRCYFSKPEPKTPIAKEKLFVLDIEGMQLYHSSKEKYEHEFVLLCVRNVYDETTKKEYRQVDDFIKQCESSEEYKNATMIAHNGGGYDYQYFIRSLEKSGIHYTFIPRPGSDHKYIEVTMYFDGHTVRFIDFMCLIPGSLKGIAQSFQLTIQKGDFPHRFLCRNTLNYIGRIPPIDTSDDFFSLQWKKSEEDVNDVKEWYNVQCEKYCSCELLCSCSKEKWDCQKFLAEYCWMDVDVLAQACQKYRDLLMNTANTGGSWNPTAIDPFCYLTQSQLAMQIFLSGFEQLPPIGVAIPRHHNINRVQFVWYHRLQVAHPELTFIHYGTNTTRYMWVNENIYIDCFCVETQTVYLFFSSLERGLPATMDKIDRWLEHRRKGFIGGVEIKYEDELGIVTELEKNIAGICEDRDFFFGGRTEVFSPYARPDDSEEIKYLDVCSLYPTICSFAMLPIGHPTIYFGSQCDLNRLDPRVSDPYFGYVRCKVIPNKSDRLGLLPSKLENGRLVFNLNDKIGMWFTEEIYLAMQCGYIITEIYEVHHFDRDNRSDTLMRGYMEAFLTLKQEAEGWKKLGASSDNPSEEEQDRILEDLFEANGGIGRVKKENVKKNPVLRQVSKIFLNCLWGKFCQRKKMEFFSELTSYKDYEALLSAPESSNMVFRQMAPGRWRVKFTKPDYLLPANPRYNIYLAAGVTAQARCYLHRQMLRIGPERVLYCDTDSIVFLYPKIAPSLTGIGLGKWTDEHPNEVILELMAIAPKCYMLNIEGDTVMKAKGCIISVENRKLLSSEVVKGLIQAYCTQKQLESVTLQNFSIFTNSTDIDFSYGTMFSRYNTKQVRCVLNKRQLVTEFEEDGVLGENIMRVTLFPEGFISTSQCSSSHPSP